ncbi:hypothetical protein BH23BAC1_BH23BAC1_27760 [soil metagenome]
MKTLQKITLFAMFLAISLTTWGQMAVVEFMKVPPGNGAKYMETEKAWKKIQEERLKAGLIEGWTLYQNMFAGADEDYQYVTVTRYKNMAAYEKSGFEEAAKKAFPEYTDKDWDDFYRKTGESRVLSKADVYHQVMRADGPVKPLPYLQISIMKVSPGNEQAYLDLEKSIYKPFHEALIKNGKMESWSVWSKYPGNLKEDQFTTVNGYSSLEQAESQDGAKVFASLFPEMNINDVMKQTEAARTMTEVYIWRAIDYVDVNPNISRK